MKKIISLFITFTLIFVFSECTVSSNMGKLTIINKSNKTISNIKIGDTTITYSLYPGGSYDYWITSETIGKLTFTGIEYNKSWTPLKAEPKGFNSLSDTDKSAWHKINYCPNPEIVYTLTPNVWYNITTNVVPTTETFIDTKDDITKKGLGLIDYDKNTIGFLACGMYYISNITASKQSNEGEEIKPESYMGK